MMSFACTGCGCKLCVRRNVIGKQVKCPRCGSTNPLPQSRLEPMPLRPGHSLSPPPAPPKPVPEEAPPPPPEEPTAKSTVETDFYEDSSPGAQLGEHPRAGELASLGARLSGRFPPREAAALVESLARAVDAANRQGSLRRETKPEEAAPEADGQARETVPTVPRDVRALGAILYECILGRPPAAEPGKEAEGHPLRFRAKAPRPLEIICLKCLEKDPAASYANVRELADDLRRFLGGEPVRARSSGWLRNSGILGLLVAALVGGGGVGVGSWLATAELRDTAERRRDQLIAEQSRAKEASILAVEERERAEGLAVSARKASENVQRAAEQEQKARERAVQAEQRAQLANTVRETAEKQRKDAQKLYLDRTKDLLVGKWKTTFPEKEKDKITEFTAGGNVLTPDGGRGTYRLLDADKLEMQMGNPGAAKEQFTIKSLTWNELILFGTDGKKEAVRK
ncbi:MAG: hypothetical protein HYS12_19595 [Planctomycetes bacterium]|nr:hypothetical protein [Planctomycetota bacterium]